MASNSYATIMVVALLYRPACVAFSASEKELANVAVLRRDTALKRNAAQRRHMEGLERHMEGLESSTVAGTVVVIIIKRRR